MPDVVGLAADAVAQARSSRSMMVMDCRLLGAGEFTDAVSGGWPLHPPIAR